MIELAEIITPARIDLDVAAASKKAVIEQLAKVLSQDIPQHTSNDVFDALVARERLGSTGLGEGVAIPHCRLERVEAPVGAMVRTVEHIDFDAVDDRPVNVFFALSVPNGNEAEHLQILAELAGLFKQQAVLHQLRSVASAAEVHRLLCTEGADV